MKHGLKMPNETRLRGKRQVIRSNGIVYQYNQQDPLPPSFDWRSFGYVTSVKDQVYHFIELSCTFYHTTSHYL